MSDSQILVLGALAGFTIFLGLPIGRLQSPAPRLKAFLSAAATGILLFLLWDVLSAGIEPVEQRSSPRQSITTDRGSGSSGWRRSFPARSRSAS